MKNPVLLANEQMDVDDILYPQKMQLTLRIDGQSTCAMTLGPDSPEIEVGRLIQIWAPNDNMCVMYVKSRKRDYTTGMQDLTLAHAFGLLSDVIAFGEIKPETMSGTTGALKVSAEDAIEYMLDQQTTEYWTLYNCAFQDEEGWKFTNSDVYSALNSIADSIEGCQWEFDFTTIPWQLSLKAIPEATDIDIELRKDRNISSLKINYDRSQMYTRAYPTGKNDIHIDSVNSDISYVDSGTTGTYGIICKVITDSTIEDPSLLKKWAKKQVKRNGVPKITITVDGYELSKLTGESLDHMDVGLMCRMTIPDMLSEPVVQRMTELSWKDCIYAPESVTCTLANDLYTMTGILVEQVAKKGGAGSKKANTEHDCELGKHASELGKHASAIIQGVRVTGPVNNIYTLEYQKFNTNTWVAADPGTFSRAIDSWTLSWVDGKCTVTAHPQEQSTWTSIVQGATTWDSNYVATVQIDAIDADNPNYQGDTGRDIIVDASSYVNAVDIDEWTWEPVTGSNYQISQTITLKTTNQSAAAIAAHEKHIYMYMDNRGWSNGSCKVYLKSTSTAATTGGTARALVTIQDPHPNAMSLTQEYAGRDSQGTQFYYGIMYYYDEYMSTYQPASGTNKYWYSSDTNRAGTQNVYY